MELTNLGDLCDREADPETVALIDLQPGGAREYSHLDIDQGAMAVARALTGRGYRRGERIAILSANRAEFLIAYFGIMRAGLVAVPVNFKLPVETVHYILADCGAVMAFADGQHRTTCPDGLPVVAFGAAGPGGFDGFLDPGRFETVPPDSGETAMFLYTSGSSGRPKGVPLSHDGQLWAVRLRLDAATPDRRRHRLLVAAPLYHMNGLGISKFAMAAHASEVLLPQFSATAYIDAIGRYRCTWLTSVPTMLALVAREDAALRHADLSRVEMVGMGSAPVTQALIDRLRRIFPAARFNNGYGTTESGPVAFGPHPDRLARPDLALGYPLADVDVRLLSGAELEADEGVLHIKSPGLMAGYHNLPEKTAQAMTDDGYYITGDIMRRDGDGFYFFVGRADDMFVCGGENIYPLQVEKMLERHPDIQQACVVPAADEIRGQKPIAFIVARPDSGLTERAVKEFALAHAPPHEHPRHVVFMPDLPLSGTNKIDRNALTGSAAEFAA
jgi:acyl-CoA synthetase (AMP-forming)/AMP-acid ligase II